ncbi:hypothetical protein HY450_00025 [Candidatus Pacearchaeota archaeon]|nr:hypothetical protein [Candidatus Pacearchaeota archaeon]
MRNCITYALGLTSGLVFGTAGLCWMTYDSSNRIAEREALLELIDEKNVNLNRELAELSSDSLNLILSDNPRLTEGGFIHNALIAKERGAKLITEENVLILLYPEEEFLSERRIFSSDNFQRSGYEMF